MFSVNYSSQDLNLSMSWTVMLPDETGMREMRSHRSDDVKMVRKISRDSELFGPGAESEFVLVNSMHERFIRSKHHNIYLHKYSASAKVE